MIAAALLAAAVALEASGAADAGARSDALIEAGRYAEALPLAEEALDDAGPAAPDRAAALARLADVYERMGRYEEAERLARSALELREAEQAEVAASLLLLGKIRMSRGSHDEAVPLFERALALRRAELGEGAPEVADCLAELAMPHYAAGRYDESERISREALALRQAALGPEHFKIGESLNRLGMVLIEQGRHDEAREALERSLAIKRAAKGADHPHVGATLNNLAYAQMRLGDFREAEPLFLEALAIEERAYGPDHPHVAVDSNNLAGLYVELGRYAEAEPLLERALRIQRATLGTDSPAIGFTLNNLALNRSRLGRHADAMRLYEEAREVWEATLGSQHPRLATVLNNMASTMLDHGEDPAALLERALAIGEATLGPDHPLVGYTLHWMSHAARGRGEMPLALEYATRTVEIFEGALPPGHLLIAMSTSTLAHAYEETGELERAETLYRRALELAEASVGADHPHSAVSLCRLGYVRAALGDSEEAERLLARGNEILARSRSRILSLLSERQQLTYLREEEPHVHALLRHAAVHASEAARAAAFDHWLRWKGTSLEVRARHRETARDDPRTRQALDELRDARRELARHWLRRPRPDATEAYRRRGADLEAEVERLERRLARASASWAAERRAARIDHRTLAQRLPVDAAYLDFALVVGPTSVRPLAPIYVVFVLLPDGDVTLVDLGDAERIEGAVADYLQRIADGAAPSVLRRYGRALYRLLIEPVAERLGDRTELWISPDGRLHLLPFELLHDPGGAPLVETRRLAYVPSGRDLLRLEGSPEPAEVAVVLADPDFDAGAPDDAASPGGSAVLRGLAQRGFLRLPGTRLEGERIARILDERMRLPVRLATGASAREETLLSTSPPPRVLHLATHGFFLDDPAADVAGTARTPSGLERLRDGLPESAEESPLRRSGLVLAGANVSLRRGLDSGVVTAEKLLGLDLHGTELVVLSGCETALGEVHRGEGVFGLERAFLVAGARSLVLSLWPVADDATRELMTAFYERWAGGVPKAEALRQAKLALRERGGHPADWGAFVLVGDPG